MLDWAECHHNVTILLPLSVLTCLLQAIRPLDSPATVCRNRISVLENMFLFPLSRKKGCWSYQRFFTQNSLMGKSALIHPTKQTGQINLIQLTTAAFRGIPWWLSALWCSFGPSLDCRIRNSNGPFSQHTLMKNTGQVLDCSSTVLMYLFSGFRDPL